MIDRLDAAGPHPDLHERLMTFGRFVGSWRMASTLRDPAGDVLWEGDAEWSFGWILDGRAIQDVLIFEPDVALPGSRGLGTTTRFYDPDADLWYVTWLGVTSNTHIRLTGGQVGEEIRLEGGDGQGELVRWSFHGVEPDAFRWTGMTSSDDGATWWHEQEMNATRISP